MSPPFPSWRPNFASWLPPRKFLRAFALPSWKSCINWIRSNRYLTWPQMTISQCRCIILKLRRFIVVLPPMMKTMNLSPRCNCLSRLIVKFVIAILLCGVTVAAQSPIIRPQSQPTTSASARRQHTAVLRASDSPDGSRVALSSDQSLNDYEAYRRGDRFYVKIPQSEVPRAEAVRGRGFADVKAQKTGDSTVVSFRLQPGATAHVEQRGNKLDVVFTMPGARSSSSGVARNDAGPAPPDNRRRPARNANNSRVGNSNAATNKNANAANRQTATAKPSPTPKVSASPSPAVALVKPTPSAPPTK